MSLKSKNGVKKLVLVLATYILVTETREEAIETVETAETSKDGKESKGKYPKNLV